MANIYRDGLDITASSLCALNTFRGGYRYVQTLGARSPGAFSSGNEMTIFYPKPEKPIPVLIPRGLRRGFFMPKV